jgi:hypothetical protein
VDEIQPFLKEPLENKRARVDEIREKDLQLAKSLDYLKDRLEFIEKDENGMKLRVKSGYYRGDFPFEAGFVVVSEYDDRKFLVTQTDPKNRFVWFGIWEESTSP